jgi:hypothetical protein
MDFVLRVNSDVTLLAFFTNKMIAIENMVNTQKQLPVIVPDIDQIFKDLQINPVAWASRYAQKYVIERAEMRVCIR